MIYLLLFIILTTVSQILLKKESLKKINLKTTSYLISMSTSRFVILAYLISSFNILIWFLALTQVSLLVAFFFSSLIYVIMVFVDHIYFNEKINIFKLLGVGLITCGIILINI